MLGRSQFLHTTAYTFTPEASSSIVSRFRQQIADETLQCWYDNALQAFRIECSSEIATEADCALDRVIRSFISQELSRLEEGDEENGPCIRFFPDVAQFHPTALSNPLLTEPTSSLVPANLRSYISHMIRVVHPENTRTTSQNKPHFVQLFGLAQIPSSILHRIVGPDPKAAKKLIKDGLTCRVVRWNEDQESYLFNGALGGSITAIEAKANAGSVALTSFQAMHDQRAKTTMSHHVEAMKTGIDPLPWIQDVERTIQLAPESKSEMPKETKKLLIQQADSTARPRIARGTAMETQDEHTLERSDSDEEDEDIPIPDSSFSNQPIQTNVKKQKHSTGPMQVPEKEAGIGALAESTNQTPAAECALIPSIACQPPRSDTNRAEYPIMQDDFGSWGKEFSVVDKWGLTATVEAAARLDMQNRRQRHLEAVLRTSVSARNRMTGSRTPTPMLTSPTPSQGQARSDALSSARGKSLATRVESTEPLWTNRVVQGPSFAGYHSENAARFDLLDNESFPPLTRWEPLRPAFSSRQQGTQDKQIEAQDEVIEQLRVSSPTNKRDTMGQQAKRRGKAKKSNCSTANLPLPDPLAPPPTRAKAKDVTNTAEQSADSSSLVGITAREQTIEEMNVGRRDAQTTSASFCSSTQPSSGPCSHDFCRVLQEDSRSDTANKPILEVNVGMIVARPMSNRFSLCGTFDLGQAEDLLNSPSTKVHADFFRVVTTSLSDACYINNLASGFTSSQNDVHYEIHFRAPSGGITALNVDISDKSNFTASSNGRIKGEAYIHYPMHMWDAHMVLKGRASPALVSPSLETFVASIETIDDLPSFKAHVEGTHFPIAAYAKRVYSRERDGLTFVLTQVHELGLHNVGDGVHNLGAFAERLPYWEVRVESEGVERFVELQAYADFLVKSMDCVGAQNDGIKTKKKAPVEEDDDETDQVYYARMAASSVPSGRMTVVW